MLFPSRTVGSGSRYNQRRCAPLSMPRRDPPRVSFFIRCPSPDREKRGQTKTSLSASRSISFESLRSVSKKKKKCIRFLLLLLLLLIATTVNVDEISSNVANFHGQVRTGEDNMNFRMICTFYWLYNLKKKNYQKFVLAKCSFFSRF